MDHIGQLPAKKHWVEEKLSEFDDDTDWCFELWLWNDNIYLYNIHRIVRVREIKLEQII